MSFIRFYLSYSQDIFKYKQFVFQFISVYLNFWKCTTLQVIKKFKIFNSFFENAITIIAETESN